jgi:hypothetical protein
MILVVSTVTRVALSTVILVVGLALLRFNGRFAEAALTGQRETIGAMLGTRRGRSDQIHDSRIYRLFGRAFIGILSIAFVAAGIVGIIRG